MSDSARCVGRCAVPLGRETTLDTLRVIAPPVVPDDAQVRLLAPFVPPLLLLPFTITNSSFVSVAIAVGLSAATAAADARG